MRFLAVTGVKLACFNWLQFNRLWKSSGFCNYNLVTRLKKPNKHTFEFEGWSLTRPKSPRQERWFVWDLARLLCKHSQKQQRDISFYIMKLMCTSNKLLCKKQNQTLQKWILHKCIKLYISHSYDYGCQRVFIFLFFMTYLWPHFNSFGDVFSEYYKSFLFSVGVNSDLLQRTYSTFSETFPELM